MFENTPFDELCELVPGRVFQIYHEYRIFRMYICRNLKRGNYFADTPELRDYLESRTDKLTHERALELSPLLSRGKKLPRTFKESTPSQPSGRSRRSSGASSWAPSP